MKKFIPLLLSFIFFSIAIKAQYVTIPDTVFRHFLQQQYPSCFNSSGMMDTTCNTVLNETKLVIESVPFGDFTIGNEYGLYPTNLEGIQYFKSLRSLTLLGDLSTGLDNGYTFPKLPDSLRYLAIQ